MNIAGKIAGSLGAIITAGFGLWHFFVPSRWKWYNYFPKEAPELVVAVRATNFFFSLSMVLLGGITLLLLWASTTGPFAKRTVLSALILLWAARVGMQLLYPQGSELGKLQYGLLAAFILTLFLFIFALVSTFFS